jgi:hypothetical protein
MILDVTRREDHPVVDHSTAAQILTLHHAYANALKDEYIARANPLIPNEIRVQLHDARVRLDAEFTALVLGIIDENGISSQTPSEPV